MTDELNATDKHPTNQRVKLLAEFTLIIVIVGFIYFVYWLGWGRFHEYTDDAYVNGNMVQLMAQTSGTVVAIYTDDTRLVVAGQPMIRLDNADANIALLKAKAALALTVRQVKQYYENAEQAKITLSLRQADLVKAQLDFKRRQGLVGNRAISAEELQHYATALKAAQDRYELANHHLSATLALVNHTQLYNHPFVNKAKEVLRQAFLNAERTVIYAPVTGYVAKRAVQVGQYINRETNLLAIIPLDQIWVDANYKETQLKRLRIQQDVILNSDIYGGYVYHGKIVGLNVGTGNAFALLPPQNATGNWIKIVQRLPVRIALDPRELQKHPLMLGLSMDVTTYTRSLRGEVLPKQNNTKVLYATQIYAKQLAEANALILSILQANAVDEVFVS